MQPQLFEEELEEQHDAFDGVALTGVALIDPVADRARLHRAAHDVVQVDLADDVVVEEHAELVGDARGPIAVTLQAA